MINNVLTVIKYHEYAPDVRMTGFSFFGREGNGPCHSEICRLVSGTAEE
jgi:hypothetical protein